MNVSLQTQLFTFHPIVKPIQSKKGGVTDAKLMINLG